MTQLEKTIYNQWLIVSRAVDSKPFKVRENFDKFEDNKSYPAVVKLANFFKRHPSLDIKTFFEAPYFVYEDKFFSLEFYSSMRAIKAYTRYHDDFLLSNPDEKVSLDFVKASLVFINDFCKSVGIPIGQYPGYTENNLPVFFKHLGERKISMYILFAFDGIDCKIREYKDSIYVQAKCCALQRSNYIRTKLYASTKLKTNIENIKKFVKTKRN
jgi:hypothetical protein